MGAAEVMALCIAAVVLAAILCSLAVAIAVCWTRRHPHDMRDGPSPGWRAGASTDDAAFWGCS